MPEQQELDVQTTVENAPEPEASTEPQETSEETPSVSLEDLQGRLDGMEENYKQLEGRYKDTQKRLTKTQQENAELYRYHNSTLPKLNQTIDKTFNEKFEAGDYQGAVNETVQQNVQPIQQQQANLNLKMAYMDVVGRKDGRRDLEDRVLELGDEHKALTYTPDGIEALFQMAEKEKLEKDMDRYKSNGEAQQQKTRAFTESSGVKATAKPKAKLTPEQRRVAKGLGLTEEQYTKRLVK